MIRSPASGVTSRRAAAAPARRASTPLRGLTGSPPRTLARIAAPTQSTLQGPSFMSAPLRILALTLLGLLFAHGAAAQGVLRVSAIPDEAPTELQRKFKPLGEYLAQETGMKVEFIPVTDYAAVVEVAGHRQARSRLAGRVHVRASQAAHQRHRDPDRPTRRGREVHQPLHRTARQHRQIAGRPQGQDLCLRFAFLDFGSSDAALLTC